MNRRIGTFCLLFTLATPLGAQEEAAREAQRQQLLKLLAETPEAHDARMRDFTKGLMLSQIPSDAHSALLVMPESGDVVRLQLCNNGLELLRDGPGGGATCGGCLATPGPFTARAFGPNEIVVAMQTGNAVSETTVFGLVRADKAPHFVLTSRTVVREVAWTDPDAKAEQVASPLAAEPLAWDAASRTATLAFWWRGTQQVVVGQVELGNPAQLQAPRRIAAEHLGRGIGAVALDVDGELHVFVRQAGSLGRAGPLRVHVRDRDGRWSQPTADVPGVTLEPEFAPWCDGGRVFLTTPVTDVRGDLANPAAREFVQTLRTFRMEAKDAGTWTPAPLQFTWSGQLRQGQALGVAAAAGRPPTVALQTPTGEVVQTSQQAPAQPRPK